MKNFVSMNMDTYSKDRINKINEHNKNRINNGKKISYLLDKKLDNNVHYTFGKIEDLEAKTIYFNENVYNKREGDLIHENLKLKYQNRMK